MQNRNCLSYWLPMLQGVGVPTPRTEIVRTEIDFSPIMDGEIPEGWGGFLAALNVARDKIGGDCFLRTGQTSGKHDWERTCHLPTTANVVNHVAALVEYSEMASIMGLPLDIWAVREMLKTAPLFTAFRGFPVVREFRCFVEDGKVACTHPYWLAEAVEQGRPVDPEWRIKLATASDLYPDTPSIIGIAGWAASVLPGAWSVDLLQDATGKWWLTDCADAGCSFHWEGCENAGRWPRREVVE